ncbi:hypothetical protein [Patiriisocius marinistellae]|nr:hypothetical protein [Patiriisocius marinistellae]
MEKQKEMNIIVKSILALTITLMSFVAAAQESITFNTIEENID